MDKKQFMESINNMRDQEAFDAICKRALVELFLDDDFVAAMKKLSVIEEDEYLKTRRMHAVVMLAADKKETDMYVDYSTTKFDGKLGFKDFLNDADLTD